MNRHKALLAISLLARAGAGFVGLFVLARALGPADYGLVATILAGASIVALLTDFGFSIKLLRDVGARPERAGEILADCFRVKTALVLPATVVVLVFLQHWQPEANALTACIFLYLSVIVLSYGELALVGLRALGHFRTELRIVLAGAAIFAAFLALAFFLHAPFIGFATAILLSRLMQSALAFFTLSRVVQLGNCLSGPVIGPLREAAGLAADTILTALSGQIDVVLVSFTLGLHATGIYQVAARASSYAMLPSQVLAGVYTPVLSARHHVRDREARALEARMLIEFPLLGALSALVIVLVFPALAPIIFGHAFAVPMSVWTGFAAFVFLRFSLGALGIALVARRAVKVRLLGQSLGAATLCTGMLALLPGWGVVAAPWVAVAATLVTALVYCTALGRGFWLRLSHRSGAA